MGYASGNYTDIPTPGQLLEPPNPFTIIPALDYGWLPQSMMQTTYPFVPTLDPHLNFPIGQYGVTGLSLVNGAEGQLTRSLALIPSWWD
jgi:hypothetical protein